jgi:hypothetical protein
MLVSELLDLLRDQPSDAEVELALVAPVDDDSDDISVDRYTIAASFLHDDEDTGEPVLWLIGGEDDDVEVLLDALDHVDDGDHDHPH